MIERELIHAAQYGGTEAAREALRKGADPNARTEDGQFSVLHLAARSNKPAICQLLIAAGADVNALSSDRQRCTALQLGVRHHDVCKVFIEAGVDLSACGPSGMTSLHWAAMSAKASAVEMLLDAGADLHALDRLGETALHAAVRGFGGEPNGVELAARTQTCRILIDRGIDFDHFNFRLATALKEAVEQVGGQLVVPLVQMGCDPSVVPAQAESGYLTPFQKAISLSMMDAVREMVLQYGQDMNQITLRGKTMFELALGEEQRDELMSLATEAAVLRSAAVECGLAPQRRSAGISPI
jgi:hypothetical protein